MSVRARYSHSGWTFVDARSPVRGFRILHAFLMSRILVINRPRQRAPTLCLDLHRAARQVAPARSIRRIACGSEKPSSRGGGRARDTVAGVKDDTRRPPRRVQRQDGLDANVHRWCVEHLEHDLLISLFAFGYIDVPPDRTVSLSMSFRMSSSHFMIGLVHSRGHRPPPAQEDAWKSTSRHGTARSRS